MTLHKLPNAFTYLPPLLQSNFHHQHKTLILFLDYDGTLTPIVARPELAIMSDEMRQVIRSLAHRYTTAIVSGRSKNNVKNLIHIQNFDDEKLEDENRENFENRNDENLSGRGGGAKLYFAGSHGFDIEGPNNHRFQVARDIVPVLKQLHDELCDLLLVRRDGENVENPKNVENSKNVENVENSSENQENQENQENVEKCHGGIEGVIIENNTFSLSVHYRLVPSEQLIERVKQLVYETVQSREEYVRHVRVTHGKMVLELRANYDWHKGKAVLHLLNCLTGNMVGGEIAKENEQEETTTNTVVDERGEEIVSVDREKIFAIYVGDDKTDEDAFRALNETGLGVGVLVANGANDERLFSTLDEATTAVNSGTNANCYVDDCSQVIHLLNLLLEQ